METYYGRVRVTVPAEVNIDNYLGFVRHLETIEGVSDADWYIAEDNSFDLLLIEGFCSVEEAEEFVENFDPGYAVSDRWVHHYEEGEDGYSVEEIDLWF